MNPKVETLVFQDEHFNRHEMAKNASSSTRFKCLVCGGQAQRKHYNVLSCNACGAFFRRTIAHRRSYFCTRQDCSVAEADGTRKLCKSCRFTKCVRVGMVMDSLWKRKTLADEDQFKNSTLLQKVVSARQATFLNKISIMGKLSAKYNKRMELGQCKPDLDQSELSKESEFEVLLIFMKQTVFEDVGLDLLDQIQIAGRVYYRWLFLTAVASTLRCSGHQTDVCYFSDRGYIPISYEDCSDFLSRHNMKNLHVAAGFGYEMLKNGLKVAQRFHAAHLDKVEFSTLTLLMILKEAKEISPKSREIDHQISILFKEMQNYYQENYNDVPLRLGTLVLLLNDINEIKQEIHEFASILALSGYNIILPRLLNRYGIC